MLSASGFSQRPPQAVGNITIRRFCPDLPNGADQVWHRPCLTPFRREASEIRNGLRSFATLKNPFFPPDVMGAFSHNPKAPVTAPFEAALARSGFFSARISSQ
jgi:hypothetical protein